jgi:gamma-glutamyl:cysteine ligase YbdK (ATP-grasp superfamily)
LNAFSGCGIELEYMIVDRECLSVLPVADELLRRAAGSRVSDVVRGALGWSNELVLHLVELKNRAPSPDLVPLRDAFQAEIGAVNALLESMGAMLMPTGMHPWMDPSTETRLWPHDNRDIYAAYDRIFDCNRHGWANLQSQHLNLPFAGDAEFARLHAAVRLLLPILPALAASSPVAEGRISGFMDTRLEHYRLHPIRVPSLIGRVIPETVGGRAEYESRILEPMYRDISSHDPQGVLRHEWLNCRGAIPRFDRSAIEIRVLDMQECPAADLAIAALVTAVARALYTETWAPLASQQACPTDALANLFLGGLRDAEHTEIAHPDYLSLFGFAGSRCTMRELWLHLETVMNSGALKPWQDALGIILERGPLARRILRAVGPDCPQPRLEAVYRELCDCLAEGRMFLGFH